MWNATFRDHFTVLLTKIRAFWKKVHQTCSVKEKNHKQKRTLSHFIPQANFQLSEIKTKSSFFNTWCFWAGEITSLQQQATTGIPGRWDSISRVRLTQANQQVFNTFNSDGVVKKEKKERRVHFRKGTKVIWGWLLVEIYLFAKGMSHLHPRKLPKLIKIGLYKNVHRMRLFTLSKSATFRLGCWRQPKKACQPHVPTLLT